ncbi:hypothetical protein, partial [Hoeflea sp.]|uniref:hypothetical protein n=1 Tax=Hoeflea sp. TaxID=1940281 RepID=UPI0025BA1CA6
RQVQPYTWRYPKASAEPYSQNIPPVVQIDSLKPHDEPGSVRRKIFVPSLSGLRQPQSHHPACLA